VRLGLILVAAVVAAGCGDDPGPAPVPTAPPPQATPTAPPAETAPTETQPAEQVPPIPESDDAAQPPSPELFFLFPAEEDARAAATELEQHGYRVRTAPPADDVPDWSVIAEGTPAGGDLKTAELAFRAWAEARDGRYDGNEIPVGP
jgi:hypothetical protein